MQLLFFVSNMAKTILVRVLGCKKQRQILVKKTENEFIGRLEQLTGTVGSLEDWACKPGSYQGRQKNGPRNS